MNTAKTTRSGWVKVLFLLVLAIGGVAGGILWSGGFQFFSEPQPNNSEPGGDKLTPTHRFPLSAADAKSQQEAPEVCIDPSGRIYLVYQSRTGVEEQTVYLVRSDDGGQTFEKPRAVARSGVFKSVSMMKAKTITRELKMVPHIIAHENTIYLAWNETLPGNTGLRMVLATSTDRGDTFCSPIPVHQGEGGRPTFTALAAGPGGSLLCSWLDNRKGSQQAFASMRPSGKAVFDEEQIVHMGDDGKGVCPCCPTASIVTAVGTAYVAFRNVEDGCRDIAIGRKKPGQTGFEGPFSIVPPTWKFNGCPHDGPSLALLGDTLHVTWMDAHTGSQRCYYASTKLSDMKFRATELHSIPAGTQGNAKLFADGKGALHAVWEESLGAEPKEEEPKKHQHEPALPKTGAGGGRAIKMATIPPGSMTFGPARAVLPKPGVFQTRPVLNVTQKGDFVIAWNELDENGKAVIVTRLASLEESP